MTGNTTRITEKTMQRTQQLLVEKFGQASFMADGIPPRSYYYGAEKPAALRNPFNYNAEEREAWARAGTDAVVSDIVAQAMDKVAAGGHNVGFKSLGEEWAKAMFELSRESNGKYFAYTVPLSSFGTFPVKYRKKIRTGQLRP